jgi:leucine efflux protein
MFGVIDITTFILGVVVIILLPGPNSLYVLSVAVKRGVRSGYRAALGVFLGDLILMVLAAAGMASLLAAYPGLFIVMKCAGAAYLAYVGVNLLRSALQRRRGTAAVSPSPAEEPKLDSRDPFRRALLICLLNPKAILFFMSFFIQFVDRSYPHPVLSFALLGLIVQVCSFLYLSALIFGGVRLANSFRSRPMLASGMSAGAGAMFIGFSAKLVSSAVN